MRAFLRPSVVLLVVGVVAVLGLTAAGASVGGAAENRRPGPAMPVSSVASERGGIEVWEEEAIPGELIVRFSRAVAGLQREKEASLAVTGASLKRDLLVPGYSLVQVPPGREEDHAERLLASEAFISVEPNLIRRALFEPNDEFYSFQWHLPQIGLPSAWDVTMGAGVTVAVLDSGVAYENCVALKCGSEFAQAPDFGGTTFVAPWDFVDDDEHANDTVGHGTHVASTIAEATNNTTGGAGVAPEASLMPVRVLGGLESGSVADEIDGLVWAADHGADVINLSLGGYGTLQSEQDAVEYAISQGAVIVAASGNDGFSTMICPACYPGVIAVGATTINQLRANYSNYGTGADGHSLDLVAPGGDVFFDKNDDGFADGVLQQMFAQACPSGDPADFTQFTYCFISGTSMASPHVAGVAALVLSVNPGLSPEEVREILTNTATDLGANGYDAFYGHGQIDAAAAVAAAVGSLPQPTVTPTPTVEPGLTPLASPTPFATPTATTTPTAGPTSAPPPTFMPASTWTPVPTWTPEPTWTPNAPPTATPTNTPSPTPVTPVGDTSCDGRVDPLDAALILQLGAGLILALPCPGGGDANGDGITNIVDATVILQFSAGMITSLPP